MSWKTKLIGLLKFRGDEGGSGGDKGRQVIQDSSKESGNAHQPWAPEGAAMLFDLLDTTHLKTFFCRTVVLKCTTLMLMVGNLPIWVGGLIWKGVVLIASCMDWSLVVLWVWFFWCERKLLLIFLLCCALHLGDGV